MLLFSSITADVNKYFESSLNAVKPGGLIWIAYPKGTSKIKTDISRDKGWDVVHQAGLRGISLISLDDVWSAIRFRPLKEIKNKAEQSNPEEDQYIDYNKRIVTLPKDLKKVINKDNAAKAQFETLSFTHKKEIVLWIINAKKEETRTKRLEQFVEKLFKNFPKK